MANKHFRFSLLNAFRRSKDPHMGSFKLEFGPKAPKPDPKLSFNDGQQ